MSATVTLTPGTLAPPACYGTEQDRFNAYVAAIIATIGGGLQWEASSSAPSDNTKYWLRVDSDGRPIEALKWSTTDGAWVRWFTNPNNTATAGGAVNAYTLTNSVATTAAVAYRPGAIYVFKATFANTGAATIAVDGQPAKPIKKRVSVDLEANDISSGQVVTVVFDGTNFQLVSPERFQRIALNATYAEGNVALNTPVPPNPITLSVTKPSNATWKEFQLFASVTERHNGNVDYECAMTFESGTITGTNVTAKPGCGNSSQKIYTTNDDDSSSPTFHRLGPMPTEYAALNTVQFKVQITANAGVFGNATDTCYAFIRATYEEPVP